MCNITLTIICFLVSISKHQTTSSDVALNTVQLIEKYNYICETHQIITEDGYKLTYHRIPRKDQKVVLLMHGTPSSSADYVNMGSNRSLAFILSDLGYDVWLGNARGNFWSRSAIILNPKKYFDFSWHEVGYYDLSAAIDYILKITFVDKLSYIGHSLGCAQILVLLSTRPEYNKKIKLASLMAPAVFIENNQNPFLTLVAAYVNELEIFLKIFRIYELPATKLIRDFGVWFCSNPNNYGICVYAIEVMLGMDPDQLDQDKIPVILSNLPSTTAMKQFIHSGQLIKNGGFSHFDYGSAKNLQKYGQATPPKYNLSKVEVPIALYYGLNDLSVNFMDVKLLVSKLPNIVKDCQIVYRLFNHIDFLFARDVYKIVYKELIHVMELY